MPELVLIPYPVGMTEENSFMKVSLTQINAEYAKYLASWMRLSLTARSGAPS
jgi:hypothetical protein